MGSKKLWDRLVPPKYDFYGRLSEQARVTSQGISAMVAWLSDPQMQHFERFMHSSREADLVRMKLEEELVEAFTTPFDRQDIYTFSVRMDRILELSKGTIQSMQAFEVKPDLIICELAWNLSRGTYELSRGTGLLSSNPREAEACVEEMRLASLAVESRYRDAMSQLFKAGDPIDAMKKREVYRGFKDAAESMYLVVDDFHRIIFRLH